MNEKLLLEIRKQQLHQYQVAGKAGISEASLSKIIRGRTRPTEWIKIRLAKALNVTVEHLFGEVIEKGEDLIC